MPTKNYRERGRDTSEDMHPDFNGGLPALDHENDLNDMDEFYDGDIEETVHQPAFTYPEDNPTQVGSSHPTSMIQRYPDFWVGIDKDFLLKFRPGKLDHDKFRGEYSSIHPCFTSKLLKWGTLAQDGDTSGCGPT